MQTIKIIMIPGNGGGNPFDGWFPYVKQKLDSASCHVIITEFPDKVLARSSYWLPFLKNELHADQNTILVGHSTGAIAAMRYAEKNQILGSVLVGVYHTDLNNHNEKLSEYFNQPWDWTSIRNHQKWIIEFSSTDDPWIPIEEPRFVQEQLKSEYYEYTDKGHFGGHYEKKDFPELVNAIKIKVNELQY